MQNKAKKNPIWGQLISTVFMLLMGGACGVIIARFLHLTSGAEKTLGSRLLSFALMLIGMYIVMFLQIIIHEAGHLIFGLLTGYHFSSFRIGSFMWIKGNNGIQFKRMSLAGTGGQCLMVPPEMKDGKLAYALYNLGGSLANSITALLALLPIFLCRNTDLLSTALLMFALIGFAFAIINGTPMRLASVDNDGYNALSLSRSPEALRSFWIQMSTNALLAKGTRLKDMDEAWFAVPSPASMKNSMTAVMGVFACNRLMDVHDFEQADQLMQNLLQTDTAIVGLHRNLMICDFMYCELIAENRQDALGKIRDKQQIKFMKSMKNFLSVLRTEYVYALLAEKDVKKADAIKLKFEKNALTYPAPGDVESERELIAIAEDKSLAI